jgi:hypothetical protein
VCGNRELKNEMKNIVEMIRRVVPINIRDKVAVVATIEFILHPNPLNQVNKYVR